MESAFTRQYQRVLDAEAEARTKWELVDKEMRRLIGLSKMGRKTSVTVPISEKRGVEISDRIRKLRKEGKLFAPAYARRWELKEVNL